MALSPPRRCVACGAPLPAGATGSICPACLLAEGLVQPDLDGIPGSASVADSEPCPPLGRLGDYDLLEEIGRGGMGVVYRARQRSLDRVVAVKLLLSGQFASPEARQRFETEARTAARLHHPHIVPTHDFGIVDGQPFLSMDWIDGPNLGTLVRDRPLPPEAAARYLRKIAAAVHHAHSQGILHRDLKPSNILIDESDEPRLTDFGLAKRLDQESDLTFTGQALGSPGFMAPEQAAGRSEAVGPATDVYALGAILYHLLTGRPPFLAPSVASVLRQVIERDPVPPRSLNPSIPRDLEILCLRCLDKHPRRRLDSAAFLADELDRFLSGRPLRSRPPRPVERLARWSQRNPRIAVLGGIAALLTLIILVGLPAVLWRIDRERRAALHASEEASRHEKAAQSALYRLQLRRAEDLFTRDDAAAGLATLAQVLREHPDDRGVATRLLDELTHRNFARPLLPPFTHDDSVHRAEFSPDGRRLLTVTRDNRAHLWDAASGRRIASLDHRSDAVRSGEFNEGLHPISAAWSPDGRWVATASVDRTARIWDGFGGEPAGEPLPHPDWVIEACFSPDSRRLATADRAGAIRLWDVPTGRPSGQTRTHDDWVNTVRFGPDGRVLLGASDDGTARLWRLDDDSPAFLTLRHPPAVRMAAFDPTGTRIATASFDGTARLWDAVTGAALGQPMRHEFRLNTVEFSPDGTRLATTSADRTARLWDGHTGQPIGQPLRHGRTVRAARFSPEGSRLATVSEDGTARLWNALDGTPLSEPIRLPDVVWWADFTPDGTGLVTASSDRTARVWDVRDGRAVALAFHGYRRPLRVIWSGNGRTIAAVSMGTVRLDGPAPILPASFTLALSHDDDLSAADLGSDGRFTVTGARDGTVCLWENSPPGRRIAGPFRREGAIHAVRFDSPAETLLIASADGVLEVREVPSGRPRFPPIRFDGPVFDAEFSPDSRRLVVGLADRTARVIDADSGRPVTEPLRHDDEVIAVRFGPDSRRLLTLSRAGLARIWDWEAGAVVGRPLRHDGRILDIAFSPEGTLVLTAGRDGTARLWSAATGEAMGEPMHHDAAVVGARFDSRGRRIVTASEDATARVWDAATGLPLSGGRPHVLRVYHADFGPEGRWIATGDGSRTLRFFEVVEAPSPLPSWLPELAETVAGVRLDEQRQRVAVPAGDWFRLRDLLGTLPSADPASGWARWFFADRRTRTLSPSADRSVADWLRWTALRIFPEAVPDRLPLAREALPFGPDHPYLLAAIARTLAADPANGESRSLAEAEALSRHILGIAPDLAEAWRTRAIVLMACGRSAESLATIGEALRREPADGYLHWTQARLLTRTGSFAEAEAAFERAVAIIARPEWRVLVRLEDVKLERAESLAAAGRTRDALRMRLEARGIPPRPTATPVEQVDLSAFYHGGLTSPWVGGTEAENLGSLATNRPAGRGFEFDLRGVVQLSSTHLDQGPFRYPARIEGIAVGCRGRRLHFLHGALQSEAEDRTIAQFVVHQPGGQRSEIPIVYGRDVYSWTLEHPPGDHRPRPVWSAPGSRCPAVRLYLTTWENPRPDLRIETVDLISTGTRSGPFLVAITAEP